MENRSESRKTHELKRVSDLSKVLELIDPLTGLWDVELLEDIFLRGTCERYHVYTNETR